MLLDGLCSQKTAIIRAIELILMLAGFISTILLFKWAFKKFCSYDLFLLLTLRKPWFYFYFRNWQSSPFYICVIINFIVIFITASSILHHHTKTDNNPANVVVVRDDGSEEDFFFQSSVPPAPNRNQMPSSHQNHLPRAPAIELSSESHPFLSKVTISDFAPTVYLESNFYWNETQSENNLITFKTESLKNQMNREKSNAEEVEVEEEDEEDDDRNVTMEETWRAINGGENPQKKQLKKSETWPESPPEVGVLKSMKKKDLKKSMTFNETISVRCRGGLMRDPSTSIEEFNGRVEAFINKFNNEMRLQRQESEQRFIEMINRSI